jgi:hypothetical protein
MLKGGLLQKITSYNFTIKNNSIKEYHVHLLTRFTIKRILNYNNNLTKHLFNMCAGYIRSKHQVTSPFAQAYHQYITSSTRLQRRVEHNYYEDIEDNLYSYY